MTAPSLRRVAPWLVLPPALAGVSALGPTAHVNAATAGFLYLLLVLAMSAWGGSAPGFGAALAAAACFNLFFLPPFGTFTVAEPANWVALLTFLGAAALVSRLVASARAGEAAAEQRRREVQALYDLGLGLFAARPGPEAASEAVGLTLAALGAPGGALVVPNGEGGADDVLCRGEAPPAIDPVALAEVRRTRRPRVAEADVVYLPLEVGGHLNGVLVCRPRQGPALRDSAARLLALAIERERLRAEAAGLEAVRASQAHLAALVRAVSHDLRTPLTAMRLEIESLGARLPADGALGASLRSLAGEQERLARRIDNLLSSARLESGLARPHPEPVEPSELFRSSRESLASVLAEREVRVRVEPDCPPLWIDPSLALETVVNLLENAARASPEGAPLELVAAPVEDTGRVLVEVRDRGAGLPPGVRRLLQAEARAAARHGSRAGDSVGGGLGLLIARGFAEASGGALCILDRPGGGSIARLEVPAAGGEAAP